MYCKVCGAKLAEKSLYCQFCGASQVTSAAPNPAAANDPSQARTFSGNAAAQVQAQPESAQAASFAQTTSQAAASSQAAQAIVGGAAPVASAQMFAKEPKPEYSPEHYKNEAEKALPSNPKSKDPFEVGDIKLTLEPYKEDLEEYERKQEERRAEEARRKEQEERDAATLRIAEQAAQRAAELALAAQKAASQAAEQAAEKAAREAQKAAKAAEKAAKRQEEAQSAQQSAFTPDYNSWHSTSGKPVSGNTYTSRRDGTTKTVTSSESSYSYNYSYNASAAPQPQPQPQPQQAPVIVNLNTSSDNSGRTYRNGYADGYHSARRERHDNHVYKSKWLAMLLCMFGGVLGLHRFYTGKIFSGLVYLFTGGFFGFGWIIDLVMIILGGFRDADGHFLQ